MSIIIQTGHQSSRSKLLIQKLYEVGLSKPLNSYTHQFDIQKIVDTIDKIILRDNKHIINKKLVDNIITDLLLANLDLKDWGWESEKNLTALDYWQHMEPDVQFIFVFDHPNNLLNQLSSQSMTTDLLDKAMNEWVAYHENILDFLKVNQDNVLLVEGSCAVDNIGKLSEELKNISPTLQLKNSWQILNQTEDNSNNQSNLIKEYFFKQVLSKYPEVTRIFNVLLDKATIKDSNPIVEIKNNNIGSLIDLLNCLKESDLADKYREQEADIKSLKEMLDDISKDKKKSEDKYIKIKTTLDAYQSEEKTDNNKYINGLEATNQLLMEQLQLAQEKIEEYYLNLDNTDINIVSSSSNSIYKKGAAEAIKKELPYVLGSTIVKHSRSFKGVIKLPIYLLNEHNSFKNNKNIPLNLEMYADSEEAEKVKRHLSYKIGKAFVEGFDSPMTFIRLPFTMIKEVKDFKKK